ncbi:MAG: uracil-DNA glycosylase family protein [Candidatus Thorarchaeota archaeon]|jgi:uracil-DNA glycosylase
MTTRKEQIDLLLKKIRKCDDCKDMIRVEDKLPKPVVYGAGNPDILIVSEIPPRGVWESGLGSEWEKSLGIPDLRTGKTSAVLINWLEMSKEDADERFFWIQRTNCVPRRGITSREKRRVRKHCSKYIQSAISTLGSDLRVILSLGKPATGYFFRLGNLSNVVGKWKFYLGTRIPTVPLFHPSGANRGSRSVFSERHNLSLLLARHFIHGLELESPIIDYML